MTQIETSKLVQYVAFGPRSDEASVAKLVMYILIAPPPVVPDLRQGHVHTQLVRRGPSMTRSGMVIPSGDANDGADRLWPSGDMNNGTDHIIWRERN